MTKNVYLGLIGMSDQGYKTPLRNWLSIWEIEKDSVLNRGKLVKYKDFFAISSMKRLMQLN